MVFSSLDMTEKKYTLENDLRISECLKKDNSIHIDIFSFHHFSSFCF